MDATASQHASNGEAQRCDEQKSTGNANAVNNGSHGQNEQIARLLGRDMLVAKDWSKRQQRLIHRTFFAVLFQAGNILLPMAPIMLVSLAVSAAMLHQQCTKNKVLGVTVEKAIQLGPTIFPVFFAAVVGRTLKIIARLCTEKSFKLDVSHFALLQNYTLALIACFGSRHSFADVQRLLAQLLDTCLA